MIHSRWAVSTAALLVACTAFGCGGDDRPPRYPVSGKVTFEGQPAGEGMINFYTPDTGPMAAPIAADGTYNFEGSQGLEAREYAVFMTPPRIDTEPPNPMKPIAPKEFPNFPERYRQATTTDLKATVEAKEDGNTFDFDMKP